MMPAVVQPDRCRGRCAIAASAVASLAALSPATGADAAYGVTRFQRSVYTTFDLAACQRMPSLEGGHYHLCRGLPGYGIAVAERAERTFIAVGTAPARTRAASQTLAVATSTAFRAAGTRRATVEWRIVIREGRQVPYAAIVRLYTRTNPGRKAGTSSGAETGGGSASTNAAGQGEVLVVMRVAGAEACHVAHVDTVGVADAIVVARRIADTRARTFDCNMAPVVVGAGETADR